LVGCLPVCDLKSRNDKTTGRICSVDLTRHIIKWNPSSSAKIARHFGKMKWLTLTCISLFEISRLFFSHCFPVIPNKYRKNFFLIKIFWCINYWDPQSWSVFFFFCDGHL
jgi:hypothetical protein